MDLSQKSSAQLKYCIDEFLIYISSVRGLSACTVKGYGVDFKHLVLILGNEKKIRDVTVSDLRACIGALSRRKYEIVSVNRFISAVRTFFSYCKKFGYIEKNPALDLHTLKAPKKLPAFMTQNEVDALCNVPKEKALLWPSRDLAIMELLYSSGCRVGELCGLKFSDCAEDFSSAVVKGKGSKERRVYFAKDARIALKRYFLERKARFPSTWITGASPVQNLFVNQRGTALSVQGVELIISRYSGHEGTDKHVTPHAFRHTFATALLANGADIRVVQELLGHSSISTTQRYTHVTTERLKEIYAQAFPHA